MQKRSELFMDLYEHKNGEVRKLAKELFQVFQEKIKKEREREKFLYCDQSESFE